jgi:hypothetical protein
MQKHGYVYNKSSLDVIGMFLEMVRSRFVQPSNPKFPWAWDPDDKKSRIVIEAASNPYLQAKDARPGIFIDRGAIVFPKIAVGDRAAADLSTGSDLFYTIATGGITMDCVSQSKGESALLGDTVAQHMVMSANILMRQFDFKAVTPVTLMPTQAWEKDDRCFLTRVQSEFSYDIAWANIPDQKKIARYVTFESDQEQAKEYSFGDSALISMNIADSGS